MGKRTTTSFQRSPKDFYNTPPEAVVPLIPHLVEKTYYEPCFGRGDLISALHKYGMQCVGYSDDEKDARRFHYNNKRPRAFRYFITNPPWTREYLHPIITNLSTQADTWLLFDADWAYTKQASIYLPYCRQIVTVGRLKWFPDSKWAGKDNCAWYLFTKYRHPQTEFYGHRV